MAELNTIMASGEIDTVIVTSNVGYLKATASANGMFLRVQNGLTTLYRIPDQDVHWKSSNATNFPVNIIASSPLNVTPDQNVLVSDGSFSVSGKLDNNSNQEIIVTIKALNNGVEIGNGSVTLLRSELGKIFVFSGPIGLDVTSGNNVEITVETTIDGVVNLRGDSVVSDFTLTKAKANPVALSKDFLSEFDWNTLPNTEPTRPGRPWVDRHGSLRISK